MKKHIALILTSGFLLQLFTVFTFNIAAFAQIQERGVAKESVKRKLTLLRREIALLEKELETVALTPGAQGPQGPQGLQGQRGMQGQRGLQGRPGPSGTTGIRFVMGSGVEQMTVGVLKQRVLQFTKKKASSVLKITYSDNFSVFNPNDNQNNNINDLRNNPAAEAKWTILLDNKPTNIFYSLYSNRNAVDDRPSNNIHRVSTLFGFVENVPAGNHVISVHVGPVAPGRPAHMAITGWASSFTFEVQEIQ